MELRFNFKVGDIVSVNEIEGKTFEIKGFDLNYTFSDGKHYRDVIYILADVETGEKTDGLEENMKLVSRNESLSDKIDKIKENKKLTLNQLLDEYNYYKGLNDFVNSVYDERQVERQVTEYAEMMDEIMKEITERFGEKK